MTKITEDDLEKATFIADMLAEAFELLQKTRTPGMALNRLDTEEKRRIWLENYKENFKNNTPKQSNGHEVVT
jgi:hypothetical protein